jgi:hypothetical protein
MTSSNFYLSKFFPNKIFSLTEPGIINGSCSMYAILPFTSYFPFILFVSLRREYRKVVLPEPTYPTTNKRSVPFN